jgi:ubiquinone/menaquinone biosynthesis C-methylase UbiE
VSADYVAVDASIVASVGRDLERAWQDKSIPLQQRALVESQLQAYRKGEAVPVFDTLINALRRLPPSTRQTLLEIGCSSGHYAEAFAARGLDLCYHGCDYSEAFIDMARRCNPTKSFDVMDATRLGYHNEQFDIAVSGCCLLHILDYPTAIAETARVAKHYAVFHRTPVFHRSPTRHFTKQAYGVKTIELHFNEQELVRLFAECQLQVVDILTIDAEWRDVDAFAMKTYVCRKVSP